MAKEKWIYEIWMKGGDKHTRLSYVTGIRMILAFYEHTHAHAHSHTYTRFGNFIKYIVLLFNNIF